MNSVSLNKSEENFYNSISHYDSVGLNFLVCGSVDNGKSTLLGRLLYEVGAVFHDQLNSITKKNTQCITPGSLVSNKHKEIDYSYILDGLQDERQQNITIDVAHRYFRTSNRNFILLDTPGHDQYVKNMAVAASKADVAIFVVDVMEGLTKSAIRHAHILCLLGIKYFVVCVNKIDLVKYNKAAYKEIVQKIIHDFKEIGEINLSFIPVSAINGDNVVANSPNTPWYNGKSLLQTMEGIEVSPKEGGAFFFMPVQHILKEPSKKFRGYAGLSGSGTISVGETINIFPSGQTCTIEKIYEGGRVVKSSSPHISLVLKTIEDVDITRGDILTSQDTPLKNSNQFVVKILWFDNEAPFLKGKKYIFKHAHNLILGMATKMKHIIDLETIYSHSGEEINNNDIGTCNLYLEKKISFLPYRQDQDLGSFIIIDRLSFETVGIGIIEHELDKSNNLELQDNFYIGKGARSLIKKQKPFVVWLTGLSGAGKSTLANILEIKLHQAGYHTYIIDGDNVRCGLNLDLGFKDSDRIENMRRISEVASMFLEAGLIVIVAAISPFSTERDDIKKKIGRDEFVEVFVDASLETCTLRDPKGLYAKQAKGEARNMTGIDSLYEKPVNPDIYLDSNTKPAVQLIKQLLAFLYEKKFIDKEI